MDAGRIDIIGMTLQDEGIEFIVQDSADRRIGVEVAHSYFVAYRGETFGPRAKDVLAEIQELAEDVHFGWKRAPKEKS